MKCTQAGVEGSGTTQAGDLFERHDETLLHVVGIPLNGAGEAWVIVVVLGGVQFVDMAPAGRGCEPAPLSLSIAFAGAVDDQTILLDLGRVEVRAETIVAVLVHRKLGDQFLEGAAGLQVPGGAVQFIQRHAGGVQGILIVDNGDSVPVLGQAKPLAIARPQVGQLAQINAQIDTVSIYVRLDVDQLLLGGEFGIFRQVVGEDIGRSAGNHSCLDVVPVVAPSTLGDVHLDIRIGRCERVGARLIGRQLVGIPQPILDRNGFTAGSGLRCSAGIGGRRFGCWGFGGWCCRCSATATCAQDDAEDQEQRHHKRNLFHTFPPIVKN